MVKKKYCCTECNKEFYSNSGLWYHKKKCHSKESEKIHKCLYCSYTTTGPKCQLVNHINSKHTPENERPFQCLYCDRGFSQKMHLHKHIKKVHNITPPENINRTIIEYHIKILDKKPVSEKTKSRIKLYKNNPIIKSKNMSTMKFYYTQILKPSHLHYDKKKCYINFESKTLDDLRI